MKIPYGISNFESVATEDYYFVDRTDYIEKLEALGERYLVFLRPRRFGKSLFVSMLEHYYDSKRKDDFDRLFSKYYIGKNKTENANKYMILKFDLSGIQTETKESTFRCFFEKILSGIKNCDNLYLLLSDLEKDHVFNAESPEISLKRFFDLIKNKTSQKIYVLIDEYDHFANEVLSFRYSEFSEIVARNGFVRKFYEVIKEGTGLGIVDRVFITGVTPITLDSLTSGFNIAKNHSSTYEFNSMMGFSEREVTEILDEFYSKWADENLVIDDMRKWYNGYLFNKRAEERVYNPDMVLYFVSEYCKSGNYPDNLVDTNIASDYGKIRKLFNIKNRQQNFGILQKILKDEKIYGLLTAQFSFEKEFSGSDFISMLYYLGLLTIKDSIGADICFSIPNYVIKTLFWDYFDEIIRTEIDIIDDDLSIRDALREMAFNGNIEEFINIIKDILEKLSNRDFIKFDEKSIKLLFITLCNMSRAYYIKSEMEVDKKYPDICFFKRPPIEINYEYIFE